MLRLISIGCFNLLFSISIFAGSFHYDNYSTLTDLEYQFSFEDDDLWQVPDEFFARSDLSLLNYLDLKTIKFSKFTKLPKVWRVSKQLPANQQFYCWDRHDPTKQFNNKIILKPRYHNIIKNNLLLDVIDDDVNAISIRITDLDGNGSYSNTIVCQIQPE